MDSPIIRFQNDTFRCTLTLQHAFDEFTLGRLTKIFKLIFDWDWANQEAIDTIGDYLPEYKAGQTKPKAIQKADKIISLFNKFKGE